MRRTALLLRDHQIIGYRENPGDAVGAYAGDVLIGLIVHDPSRVTCPFLTIMWMGLITGIAAMQMIDFIAFPKHLAAGRRTSKANPFSARKFSREPKFQKVIEIQREEAGRLLLAVPIGK
jgi:hypothetical protein